jgi:hypothetical protein
VSSLIKLFIGTDFFLRDDIRKIFERTQQLCGKNFNMEQYFEDLVNNRKTLNLSEFEDFLSKSMIKETNRVYQIIGEEECECFVLHSKALRNVISALTFSIWAGFKALIPNFHHIVKMSLILRSAPEHTRVLLLAPQLTLIHNFTNMIINRKGDMSDLQPYHFLEPVSKLFVAETTNNETGDSQLVFVRCNLDTRNTSNNIAFGPKGLQCPGAQYTFKFIKTVTEFFKNIKITITGEPQYEGSRFVGITNKEDIYFTFEKVLDVNQ